jgi:aryl-alcohol dehydrogenase-like predicted oxidoreductase
MSMIPTRPLGRTDLTVTRLGYGAMEVRGTRIWRGREVDESQAQRILDAVLDSGITFVDTSNDYGRSEEFIGRFLASRRDEYTLATKVGCRLVPAGDHDETTHEWTRDHLLWNIDDSLKKLGTDHVDLLQFHNATVKDVEDGKLVDVLREIKSAGLTRWIGASSVAPDLGTFIEWGVFDAFQVPYSALERTHEHLLQQAHDAGAGTIVRGGVAKGEPGVGRGAQDRWRLWDGAKLDELLGEGESRTQWMLRFTLSHPGIDTIIVGTLEPEHLALNVRAVEAGPLPADVYAEAKRRLDAAGERAAVSEPLTRD